MDLSVIIPVFNEEKILSLKADYFKALAQKAELIFVDGGSDDDTVLIVQKYSRVVISSKNRALQMNKGAKEAKGNVFLFLHADSHLPIESLSLIQNAVEQKKYVGGCFKQVIDHPGLLFKWIAFTGNIRACLSKIFYGDQAIFVRKDVFWELGGFPKVKLAEDIFFTKQLRCVGKVGVLPAPIFCSARRWTGQGIMKTFLLNMRISFQFAFCSNAEELAEDYRDIR